MFHLRLRGLRTPAAGLFLGVAAVAVAACGGGGGGGNGFSVDAPSLTITSTTISEAPSPGDANTSYESADAVRFEIPLEGGCGGPYEIAVIQGALPRGIAILDGEDPATQEHRHRFEGTLLEDGDFSFRLQVTDVGCQPFASTTADFTWSVARGRVTIVDALPALHAPGTYVREGVVQNPLYPALESTVYGQFTTHEFVVAGGTPPYAIELVDDPSNASDGSLPLGTSIPPASRSILGAPLEVKPGGPFVITLRASDSTGATSALLTVQWAVTTPAILLVSEGMPDGQCGAPYSAVVEVKDGVPPFRFELVACDVNRGPDGEPSVTWQSPLPPAIAPACATQRITSAGYPGASELGPDYRSFHTPPEGVYLGDAAGNPLAAPGVFAGTPRRRGDFSVVVRVVSTVVPNERGQQSWGAYEFSIAPSEPPSAGVPPFGQDPAYTSSAAFPAVQPYARIADAEIGAAYNPDSATHSPVGLQLLARGGVRKDGLTDAPHASEVVSVDGLGSGQEDASTPGGGYDWTVDPNPSGDGDAYSAMPPGMALDGWLGVWRVTDSSLLQRQSSQALEFQVRDQQLPLQVRNTVAQRVNFAVGPDKLIITESTTSGTTTTGSNWLDMNDGAQTVRVCLPYTNVPPVLRDLQLGDLTPTHAVPGTANLSGSTALATLLSSQDLLRVCVNPAGWWNDVHNLNVHGARSGTHADRNGYDQYIWGENDLGSSSDYSRQPSATAVDLPAYRPGPWSAVTHAPASGVYTDGGKMYLFSNSSYFGAFVIRSDASIYVPFAISTTTAVNGRTYNGFGDGVANPWSATGRSQLRMPHMAVSPDGRFAAVKIKTQDTNFFETAATTDILLFSLTGEKAFGSGASAQTWCVIGSGSAGNSTTGTYLYAPSLVMTNTHLYFLCGNLNGTLSTETASRQHFIYRFAFADPSNGAVTAGTTGTASFLPKADALESQWANTTSAPMQARFHLYMNPLVSGYTTASFMHMDGGNLLENSLAPMPFRVSADGRAVAILAMIDQTTTNANSQAFHVWVDFQGSGVRRLSSAARHTTGGGSRGYTLARGSNSNTYENWHRYGGPTTQLEISDDASKVAVVANRFAGSPSYTAPTSSWPTSREDVIAYRTTDNLSWTELPVTGDGGSNTIFSSASSAIWRFGALVFTKDSRGLVFWGGFSSYYAASSTSSYQYSHMLAGTLYGVDISSATSITGLTVTSLLPTTDGGSSAGVQAYSTSSPYNPTLPVGTYSAVAGVIKPYGGFLSRNREFLYIVNKGGLSAASAEYRLVGVNVRSTDATQNVNGRTDFRAYAVGNWPTRRGFIAGTYNYYAQYGLSSTDYPAYRKHGMGMQMMSEQNGWVFFGSQYQASGPSAGTASSSYGGPIYTTYSYDYASYGGEVEGFAADVGGNPVRLTAFNADTSIRRIHFLEPVDEGSAIAFVYDTYSTSNGSPSYEQLHALGNVAFTPAGAGSGTPSRRVIEGTAGRISDAVAFSSSRDRLYYGAGSNANENGMTLKEATFGAGNTVTLRTLSATPRRYNVLHAAR